MSCSAAEASMSIPLPGQLSQRRSMQTVSADDQNLKLLSRCHVGNVALVLDMSFLAMGQRKDSHAFEYSAQPSNSYLKMEQQVRVDDML